VTNAPDFYDALKKGVSVASTFAFYFKEISVTLVRGSYSDKRSCFYDTESIVAVKGSVTMTRALAFCYAD
jgi:hypothetical protein